MRRIRGAARIAIGVPCAAIPDVWHVSAGERATKKPARTHPMVLDRIGLLYG